MKCRLCESGRHKEHYYADVCFNEKLFSYYKCKVCGSVNIFPEPDSNDIRKMYGGNDHSYLRSIEKIKYNFKYPKSNHQGMQLSFLARSGLKLENKTLLDFACGSGFYMKYAEEKGASVIGIEFDSKFAHLISDKSGMQVFSLLDFKTAFHNKTFDYFHFGHILEHLSYPGETLEELRPYMHSETVCVFDGPLDKNLCVTRLIIDFGTRLLRRKVKQYPPQHLSLTTATSQKKFFERNGFQIQRFKVREQRPPSMAIKNNSFKYKTLYLFSFLSIFVSSLIPGWGNVFHCIAIKK